MTFSVNSNYSKRLALIILLFISKPAISQSDSSHTKKSRLEMIDLNHELSSGQKWATIAMFIPASVLMINNHEIGHTVFSRICGDRSSHYYFYHNNSLGFNVYDHTKLSRFGNTIVPLGGVVFSQSLAQASNLALKNIPMSPFLQRTTALIYTIAKFDQSFQVLQGLLKSDKFYLIEKHNHPSGTDIVDFGYYAANGQHKKFIWINAGLVAITALDIYLSRHQIKRNWQVLFNKKKYVRNSRTKSI